MSCVSRSRRSARSSIGSRDAGPAVRDRGAAAEALGEYLTNARALARTLTYQLNGQTLQVTTAENVARAHREGYAWHTWLSDDGESRAIWTRLLDMGVDGVMTAKPKAFAKLLRERA